MYLCFPSHRSSGAEATHTSGQRYKLCSYLSAVIGLEGIFGGRHWGSTLLLNSPRLFILKAPLVTVLPKLSAKTGPETPSEQKSFPLSQVAKVVLHRRVLVYTYILTASPCRCQAPLFSWWRGCSCQSLGGAHWPRALTHATRAQYVGDPLTCITLPPTLNKTFSKKVKWFVQVCAANILFVLLQLLKY